MPIPKPLKANEGHLMGDLPTKRSGTPLRTDRTLPPSDGTGLPERTLLLLIPLVFVSVAITYIRLEDTLMGMMTASRWMVLFGAGSFLTLYLLREKLHLDLTDGIILSVFVVAPLLMASMLTVNRHFHTPFSESHRVVDVELDGDWAVIHLANGAYDDFYRIRHIPACHLPLGDSVIYNFGNGLLGWQVLVSMEFHGR